MTSSPTFGGLTIAGSSTGDLVTITNTNTGGQARPLRLVTSGSNFALLVETELSTSLDTGGVFTATILGETFGRFAFYSDGKYGIGSGSATRDIVLSRYAAGVFLISGDGASSAGGLRITGDLTTLGTGSITGLLTLGTQATGSTHAVRADRTVNLSIGNSLTRSGYASQALSSNISWTIDTIQDIRTSASPLFTGATLGQLSFATNTITHTVANSNVNILGSGSGSVIIGSTALFATGEELVVNNANGDSTLLIYGGTQNIAGGDAIIHFMVSSPSNTTAGVAKI